MNEKPADRVTVAGHINFQGSGQKPLSLILRYDRSLKRSQQPYQRGPIASPTDWERIDLGWLVHPGLVILQNMRKATTNLQVAGGPVGQDHDFLRGLVLLIPPGETLQVTLPEDYELFVKGDGSDMLITAFSE